VRGIWIRRLLPASVLGIVLGFSYFAPAVGFVASPVNSATHTNCGRFGYGYHGGKHDFVCPTHEPKPAVVFQAPAVGTGASTQGAQNSTATHPPSPLGTTDSGAAPLTPRVVVDVPVRDGIGEWRAFVKLLLTELN
jgi:hypothetical protein